MLCPLFKIICGCENLYFSDTEVVAVICAKGKVQGGGSCATVNVAVAVTGISVDVEVGNTAVGMNVRVDTGVKRGRAGGQREDENRCDDQQDFQSALKFVRVIRYLRIFRFIHMTS